MYERFLENNADAIRQPVDAAEIAKYTGRVPEQLLVLWQEAGRGTFCGGMVRLVDPADYQAFVDRYFRKAWNESAVPFLVTAFGDLFACVKSQPLGDHIVFLNIRYGTFQILPNRPEILCNIHLFDKRHYYALDRYPEIREKAGTPQPDECLGYVPPLALGGTEEDGNIQRLKLLPYIQEIAQVIGDFEPEDFSGKYPWIGPGRVPKKKRFVPPTEDAVNQTITDIARRISGADPAVMQAIHSCVSDISTYCSEHAGQYEDRNTDPAQASPLELKWLGMVDILLGHGYAWELDWRCELEDFEFALQEILKKNEDAGCLLKALGDETLSEDDNITVWCTRFSKACPLSAVGCIDIDSDSYVIFPTQKTVLDRFWQAAAQIGQKVAPVENS